MIRKQEPHKHSVFNRLSEDRKDSILEYGETHTLAEIITWLADDGLAVKRSALSRWLLLARFQRKSEDRQAKVDAIIQEAQARGEIKTADELRLAGQILMEKVALEAEDPKLWFLTETLALKKEKQKIERDAVLLAREKFQFDAAKACLKVLPDLKAIAANSKLDDNAKIDQIRLKLFGEIAE